MSEDCVFCQIVTGKLSAHVWYEDEWVMAFNDINPVAPVHVLIVPKKHIATVNEVAEEDVDMMGRLFTAAAEVARRVGVAEDGYRLTVNVGKNGRQEIMHVHMHLMGGMKLPVHVYRMMKR